MIKDDPFFLDPRFRPHNMHHRHPDEFASRDPQLSLLRDLPAVHKPRLLETLPLGKPGIYSITGGRQVGKTTLLKQWMERLLRSGVAPLDIVYLTGELIDDHHSLVMTVRALLEREFAGDCVYLLLDEVTYIREWDRGVKYLADAGLLRKVVLVLTGSDAVVIRDARMRLPGRRGGEAVHDFHLYPLSFHDFLRLDGGLSPDILDGLADASRQPSDATVDALRGAFGTYLSTGGYLTAINDLKARGTISPAVYAVYCDWIRGDVLKRGKSERYLKEVLGAVVKRLGSQITWNALASDLSIDHPATIADYVELLARMDVLTVLPALVEDRLSGAPKKARKVVISDPFVLHAVRSWLAPAADPYSERTLPLLADPEWAGRLAELCAGVHHARLHPTFYIKAEGEVDVAYVDKGRFWPLEVKWTGQVRPGDLKQLRKYPNGSLLSSEAAPTLHGIRNELLPLHLLRLGPSPDTTPVA